MCQVGTAFAARTDHASLRQVGMFTNPLLLWGIAFELAFTAVLVYVPAVQHVFGTTALPWDVVALTATFPLPRLGHRGTPPLDDPPQDLVKRMVAATRTTAHRSVRRPAFDHVRP